MVEKINETQWETLYKPISYPLDKFNNTDSTLMYETYGKELNSINKYQNVYVWSLVETSSGGLRIVNGRRIVNLIGYYLTELPWQVGDDIEVFVDSVEELLEKHYSDKDKLSFITVKIMKEYKQAKIEKYFRFLKSQCLEMANVKSLDKNDFDYYQQACLKYFTKA